MDGTPCNRLELHENVCVTHGSGNEAADSSILKGVRVAEAIFLFPTAICLRYGRQIAKGKPTRNVESANPGYIDRCFAAPETVRE
jgi:hypothetical protein